jgi:hypothetical protein
VQAQFTLKVICLNLLEAVNKAKLILAKTASDGIMLSEIYKKTQKNHENSQNTTHFYPKISEKSEITLPQNQIRED